VLDGAQINRNRESYEMKKDKISSFLCFDICLEVHRVEMKLWRQALVDS